MLPMKNIIACATDGAAGRIGKYRGFTAFLTKAIPHVMTIHCVVHWQNLVAKNEEYHWAFEQCHGYWHKICKQKKEHPLNSRLFKQLCSENDEEFERLMLHTEVRFHCKAANVSSRTWDSETSKNFQGWMKWTPMLITTHCWYFLTTSRILKQTWKSSLRICWV